MMSELEKQLSEIDPDTYMYTAAGVLTPVHTGEMTIEDDLFVKSGENTVFAKHRLALESSSVSCEAGDNVNFLKFGGSVACLSLLRLPSSDKILASLSGLTEDDFARAITEASLEASSSDEDGVMTTAMFCVSKTESILILHQVCNAFADRSGLTLDQKIVLTSGAAIFNFALADLADTIS